MKLTIIVLLALIALENFAQKPVLSLENISQLPVISSNHPDAIGIKKGFEGGMVTKIDGVYHGFFTERISKPRTLLTKLGYWQSKDGDNWNRISTLYTSNGNPDGTDPRATLFAPMVEFNKSENQWEIFYVSYIYNAFPARGYTHTYGKIWRGVSTVKGKEGIGGPYKDVSIILQLDGDMQPWEGAQGIDSFFPYKVGSMWYGWYGTGNTEVMPQKSCESWLIGLASANELAGPWKRLESGNPVNKRWMVENPIVIKTKDYYIAIADMLRNAEKGANYSTTELAAILISKDGVNWEESQIIDSPSPTPNWYKEARTPLSFIDEGNGIYTVFFTGYIDYNDFAPVGKFTLKLSNIK